MTTSLRPAGLLAALSILLGGSAMAQAPEPRPPTAVQDDSGKRPSGGAVFEGSVAASVRGARQDRILSWCIQISAANVVEGVQAIRKDRRTRGTGTDFQLREEVDMNKFKTTVLATCLLATASAFAMGDEERAEMYRQNTERMIPPAIAAASFDRATPRPTTNVSEAQRKTDAFNASTDMMIPPAIAARVGDMASPATGRTVKVAPADEDDVRMAEFMQRTERMKPN